jgi:hypothetical protein
MEKNNRSENYQVYSNNGLHRLNYRGFLARLRKKRTNEN